MVGDMHGDQAPACGQLGRADARAKMQRGPTRVTNCKRRAGPMILAV
jgi:hypothetical protein